MEDLRKIGQDYTEKQGKPKQPLSSQAISLPASTASASTLGELALTTREAFGKRMTLLSDALGVMCWARGEGMDTPRLLLYSKAFAEEFTDDANTLEWMEQHPREPREEYEPKILELAAMLARITRHGKAKIWKVEREKREAKQAADAEKLRMKIAAEREADGLKPFVFADAVAEIAAKQGAALVVQHDNAEIADLRRQLAASRQETAAALRRPPDGDGVFVRRGEKAIVGDWAIEELQAYVDRRKRVERGWTVISESVAEASTVGGLQKGAA